METAELQFMTLDLPTSKTELAPLSYEQAIDLIDQALDSYTDNGRLSRRPSHARWSVRTVAGQSPWCNGSVAWFDWYLPGRLLV